MSVSIRDINNHLEEEAGRKEFSVPPVVACVTPGTEARLPDVRPCMEIRWGNSDRDELETNDEEVLCLIASNPYINVVFKNLTVVTILTSLDGNQVPVLPDGTPSVEITPSNIIYFGDIPVLDPGSVQPSPAPQSAHHSEHTHPCKTPAPPLDPTSVVREVVLISRGAQAGEYTVKLEYSFSVELLCPGSDEFKLELVYS